jgi:transcriptional regulator with XRE-family HTH domain
VCDYRTMAEDRDWNEVGDRLRQARMASGMSQSELADRVSLDRTMIAKIEAGNRRVDAFELARLASALLVPMDYLLWPTPQVISRRTTPIVEDTDTEVARESQLLEIALLSWLAEVRQVMGLGVLHPKTPLRYDSAVNSEDSAREAASWVRNTLGFELQPIESLIDLCEKAGQLVLVTEVPGDGASVVDGDVAASVVSLRGDPGRRRATAAHELGHLILGDEYSSDLGVHASRAEREAAIDAFAGELLLPAEALAQMAEGAAAVSRDQLVQIAAHYRTSWSMALKQAERGGLLPASDRRRWAQAAPTHAEFMEALRWVPQPDLESVRVPPSYAHGVMEAWRRGLITRTRVVELMHGQISMTDLPEYDDPDIAP